MTDSDKDVPDSENATIIQSDTAAEIVPPTADGPQAESIESNQPHSEGGSVAPLPGGPDEEIATSNQPLPESESVEARPEETPVESAEVQQPLPEGQGVAPKPDGPSVEKADERKPAPEYEIIQSKREEPESNFATGQFYPFGAGAQGQEHNAAGVSPLSQARLSDAAIERIRNLSSSQTKVYAGIGIGLGLLVGLAVAVIFLHPNAAGGSNEMESVTAREYGLKGHLTTNWKEKLEYQLTLEPADPGQRAAFAIDVNASPRPLSVTLQLKDPFGAVLCGNTILLKFDPRNAPGSAVTEPGPKAGRVERDIAARNQIAQALNLARQEGEELNREHGKDIFQNDIGKDGQIASISSQGTLPCTRKQFENIASWGFTSDFPVVTKPAGNQNPSPEPEANVESPTAGESSGKSSEAAKSSAAAKLKKRLALGLPPIYIEGDDAIVWFDPASAVVETSAGKAMMLDKTDTVSTAIKGRELPIPIHYRCDQSGSCTFSALGLGIHHAKLKR